jgi:DNA-binding IscR family transcriptional regulator
MWEKVRDAISEIYDSTTFKQLVEEAELRASHYMPSYAI